MLIAIEQTTYSETENKQETKIIYPLSPTTVRAMLRKNNVSIAKWFGKANCFHYRRGTLPSYGYFLLSGRDIPIITYPNGVATGPAPISVIIDTFYNLDPDKNVPMVPVVSTDLKDANYKIKIENLAITEVEAITPSKGPTDAVYLVKVEDEEVSSWSHRIVDRNFNVPIGTYDNLVVPEETPECADNKTELERNEEIEGLEVESIDIVYDPSTVKLERVQKGNGGFHNVQKPITWKEMFQFIISHLPKDSPSPFTSRGGGLGSVDLHWNMDRLKDLDDTDVTYPLDSRSIEIVPEGVFFKAKPGDKPVTIKEALDYLFSITGYTIVHKPDGSFQLVQIDATEVDQLLEVDTNPISHFKDHLLKFNTHRTIFMAGTTIPRYIHFVFPKIWSTDPKDDKIEKVIVDDIIESRGHAWKVRALLYFHGKAVDTINNNGPVHEHRHGHWEYDESSGGEMYINKIDHTHEHAHDSTDSLPHTHTHPVAEDGTQTNPLYENARTRYAQFFKGQLEAAWSGLGIELLDYECLTFLPLTPNHALSEVIWSFPGDGKPARTWLSTFPYEVSSIKDTPDVDRRGMQRIMISKTIPGDTWDDGEEDGEEGAGSDTQNGEEELTPKLVPTEAKVWLLHPVTPSVVGFDDSLGHADGEPVKYEALAQIKVQHDFIAPIEIDAEKGRIGKCIDFQIMNVDCEQVKFIPPNTPDSPNSSSP